MRYFLAIMIASQLYATVIQKHQLAPAFVKEGAYMGVKILDSKVLEIDKVDRMPFFGISDLAYDAKEDIFYALSDRAKLFTLDIEIKDKHIVAIKALSGKPLKDKNNRNLWGKYTDSEGLVYHDKRLFISFERAPRIISYTRDGTKPKTEQLPKILQDINHYQGRNDALEALTWLPNYGLVTTSEYPLRGTRKGYHDIFTQKGKHCAIKPVEKGMGITEFEAMADGNLLVLSRRFDFKSFSFQIALQKVFWENPKAGICESKVLFWMDSKEGWNIDNFEGLTHYKDNLYIMITDDNNNPFEKTIVTLFEIKE